jgi:pyruvate,water dikinase
VVPSLPAASQDVERVGFVNSMHFPEVVPAFDSLTSEIPYTAIGANTARCSPSRRPWGIEYRNLHGRVYITANPVTDRRRSRRDSPTSRSGPATTTPTGIASTGEWQQRIEALIAEIEAVEVPAGRSRRHSRS